MNTAGDPEGDRLGMWLFLFGELLLFGGLFILYAVYFSQFRTDFTAAGEHMNLFLGTANTVILLVSSFCVASALTSLQRGNRRAALAFLCGAMALALFFLGNKYVEWSHEIHAGFFPRSETLLQSSPGTNLFFGLYYLITGLHGLHVMIGGLALAAAAGMIHFKMVTPDKVTVLDNVGLYWHLVDLIWIFVFPLFYLVV